MGAVPPDRTIGIVASGLFAVASLLAAAPATAQGAGELDLQVLVGFSDTYRLGRWTPVTVTVANRGRDLAGHLDLQVTEGDGLRGDVSVTTYRRDLVLPGGSRRRLRFTAYLESFARPLSVRVEAGGREVTRRTIDLRHRFTQARLVAVLGRDVDLDYLNEGSRNGVRVVYPHPDLLPDRWQGYDGVAALLVHGTTLERLDDAQNRALEKWIAGGGVLAVSGGPDYSLLRTPRLAALLPGIPVGTVRIPDGAAIGDALGARLDAPAPFEINRIGPHRGRVVREVGGIPLLVEERRGKGRVVYLTFDVARYPFARWSGMRDLLTEALRLAPDEPRDPPLAEPPRESPVPAVIAGRASDFPGHGAVLAFLALYLGGLLTLYRLRPAGAGGRRAAALAAAAAPLVAAPLAWLLFGPLLFPAGASAVTVAVLEPLPGSPYAEMRLDIGLYANRTRALRLGYAGAEPALRPLPGASPRGEGPGWLVREGAEPVVEPRGRRAFVLHLLEGTDVVDYDLQASVRRDAGGAARLRVRNRTGRTLENAWLIEAGRAHSLGAIDADGQVLDAVLSPDPDAVRADGDDWREILAGAARGRENDLRAIEGLLERRLAVLYEGGTPGAGEALLIGFTASPLRLTGRAWHRSDLTLVVLPIEIASADAPA